MFEPGPHEAEALLLLPSMPAQIIFLAVNIARQIISYSPSNNFTSTQKGELLPCLTGMRGARRLALTLLLLKVSCGKAAGIGVEPSRRAPERKRHLCFVTLKVFFFSE